MTEAEWGAGTSPDGLLSYLGGKRSKRKSRLLACACCRRMGEFVPAEFREMLTTAERYADGQVKKSELPSHIKKFRHLERAAGAVVLAAHKHGSVESLRMAMAEARWVLAANGRGGTSASRSPPRVRSKCVCLYKRLENVKKFLKDFLN